jgi:hypothetical protein
MIDETWICPSLTVMLADGSRETVSGEISVTSLGQVELTADFPGWRHINEFADRQTVHGSSSSGFAVQVMGASCVRCTPTGSTTRAIFAPFECQLVRPGAGPHIRQEFFLKALRVFGPCSFSDGTTNYQLSALPDPDDQRKGTVRAVLSTTGSTTCNEALVLLSLAQRCMMRYPIHKSYDATGLAFIRLVPNEFTDTASNPLIPQSGPELARFMDLTLAAYPAVGQSLQLHRLIQYYCISVASNYAELKFILASVFMEGFKFYWALNVGRILPIHKKSGIISGFEKAKSSKGKPVAFEFAELLATACQSYGLNLRFSFIEDRNAMFHTGAPGAYQHGVGSTWAAIEPELIVLYRQIDDILLTLLKYSGPIHRWDTPDQTDMFP